MTTKKSNTFIVLVLMILALTSCMEKKTSNAIDTFKYWAGTKPPTDLELLSGQYWQSSHWTKEYILFLKFKPSNNWWNEFLKQNALYKDSSDRLVPDNAPIWFNPSFNSVLYRREIDFDQGSRYFRDSITGICYIYEIQL